MLNLDNTLLTNCVVHLVGNKNRDEKVRASKKELVLDEDLQTQLMHYFLKNFKGNNESYKFHHDVELKMNEVFALADNLFEEKDIIENSAQIANHLFQQTRNPAIKSGELFVALFEEIVFEDTIYNGVGIFKSERKDNFFKISDAGRSVEILLESGINQQKLDKGCLILNDSYHEGYRVFCYEHNNADTEYWRNDFLNIVPRQDNYFQTKNLLSICKEFVKDKLPEEFEVTKAEQIDFLNKSIDYFKGNEDFKLNDFAKEVFEEPEVAKSFKKYKKEYEQNLEVEIQDSFEISAPAVKKQGKIFKSVLKLDKNFHIYIHGDRDLIEQGTDKDGRKFYKIYFEHEL
jgi:hypothetical protein